MTALDDDFLDRIVDGGLTPTELRAAIDRLDREPDGWKRCGLAFLEAQCWRESFRALGQPTEGSGRGGIADHATSHSASPTAISRLATPHHRGRDRRGLVRVGVARPPGSTVIAVQDRTTPTAPVIATHQDASTPLAQKPEMADPAEPVGEFVRQPDKNRFHPNSSEGVVASGARASRLGSGSAEVPILAGPNVNEQWLRNQPPRLNEYQQALLERHGYQVNQHRRIIIATLADGRRVTLPIDQVQVRYTGNNPL